MSLEAGFDAQVPSLPAGGGAVHGLGDTFTPDLATGTGTYVIPLDLPNGPNDIAPRINLRYDTSQGNGPFGQGFAVPLPRLIRSIARGLPSYDADNSLMLEGAGELLSLGNGKHRLQVDGGLWSVEASGEGFQLTDRNGLRFFLGRSSAGQLRNVDASGNVQVYAWHLERIEDSLGNAVLFEWRREGVQLYLAKASYGAYEVRFAYSTRPDTLRWGRAGFLITTTLRCDGIELHYVPDAANSLLRRWAFTYTQASGNGASLLTKVTLSGFGADGTRLDAPALTLGYSQPALRELARFTSIDADATPGPLAQPRRRMELLDWSGDGLPDLLEISSGGRARCWPNLGECAWGRPEPAGDLPWLADPHAAVGLMDLDGDGAADLIRADRPLAGYLPRIPGGGFGRPVVWDQSPAIAPDWSNARLVDLDGDGRADLMATRDEHLLLFYRDAEGGWSPQPQSIPRSAAPVLDLSERHVRLADMSGDGSLDIVRVDGARVTWWPYLGAGRWGEPIQMANSPQLPFDVQPGDLYLADIDGDGCADLLYVYGGCVHYWINRSGEQFSDEHIIDFVPAAGATTLRLADMRGSGTAGLLWSSAPSGMGSDYFYLDFNGAAKPYLLTTIDNGLGLTTRVDYTTSSREAARARREGRPWSTSLPLVIPVVAGVAVTDATVGAEKTSRYRYFNGRWDGILREFCGFAKSVEEQIGDATQPTLVVTTWFHVGLDPDTGAEPRELATRRRWRALRGRARVRERTSPDGSPSASLPFDRVEHTWSVVEEVTPGGVVYIPRLRTIKQSAFERTASTSSVVTTENLAWDARGNVVETLETSLDPRDPASTRALRTRSQYAADPTGRFVAKPVRIRQFDGDVLVADTLVEYDNAPEGQVGARGLVTRRQALAVTDAILAQVYGGDLPAMPALGYFRRNDTAGWWVTLAQYERFETPGALSGRITGPLGAPTEVHFESLKQFPVRFVLPLGHEVRATYDPRLCRPIALTDESGGSKKSKYDALARLRAVIEDGDTDALPTRTFNFRLDAAPVAVEETQRAKSGAAGTIQTRKFYDGSGRLLECRTRDSIGEIAHASQTYGARGLLARRYTERRAAASAYVAPTPELPHVEWSYDALGRIVKVRNADGTAQTFAYGPGIVEEADEEDSRQDAGAPHAGTVTRRRLDANGRVAAVEQRLGARTLTSTYAYDIKGTLLRHVDSMGRVVSCHYDLLGRMLRVDRPEQVSTSVFDACGNIVESRLGDRRVVRTFDAMNRTLTERQDSEATPSVRMMYHLPGQPVPSGAGPNAVGRLARVEDAAGTRTFGYDTRGNATVRTWRAKSGGPTFRTDIEFRSDGQATSVRYPAAQGSPRPLVTHTYDERGLLTAMSSAIARVEYDLAGRPTLRRHANGVEWRGTYDQRGRPATARLVGPDGEIWSAGYEIDGAGNLLAIQSPDPKVAATYEYDDLYRLTAGTLGAGEQFTYQYDDAGNLTRKSDVGDYHYGENGAPPTCVTSAGAGRYTYTPGGQVASAPWGTHIYDALGRLAQLTQPARTVTYRYDYAGRRVTAQAGDGSVDLVTPDEFFSIVSGELVLQLGGHARVRANGTRTFLHRDHLGSLIRVTNDAGALVESLRYDPYGALLERTGSVEIPLGFGTGVPDDVSGLLHLGAREYHPKLGRFLSPDAKVTDASIRWPGRPTPTVAATPRALSTPAARISGARSR